MGISLLDCCDSDIDKSCEKVYSKIYRLAKDLVGTGEAIEKKYDIPIVNKRISVTPIAILVAASGGDPVHIGVWHQQNMVVFKPHDLCSHLPARYAVVDSADIAHRCNDIFNLSRQAVGFRMIDLADHLSEHVLDSFPPGWADSLSRLPEYQPA